MRQIGLLPTQEEATRFADYLLTQGVEVKAEADASGWVIWVRDENHLERARDELEQFTEDPSDPRYQKAERAASAIRREENQRREQYRRNTHEMRDRWNRPLMQRRPLTVLLIALCVLVAALSGFGRDWSLIGHLSFAHVSVGEGGVPSHARDGFREIKGWELWRLVTPIFIHFGTMHLLFNSYVLYVFGGMIEERRGTATLGFLVLVIAVVSNVVEYWIDLPSGQITGRAFFGGMSGVIYGLLGYIWMKTQFDPKSGLYLDSGTLAMLMIWLVVCLVVESLRIANAAHVSGLLTGIVLGYAPHLFQSSRRSR